MDDYLQFGGFPEIAFMKQPETIREIHAMYARSILYQDIATRFGIKKPVELENLFYYLAANVSSLYTCNSLAKLTDLSDKTIKEYLSCFSDAYLLFSMEAFSYSVKQQMKRPKKIYSIDSGLASSVSFRFSDDTGRHLENAVFLELKRRGMELFYYKTENSLEVDFVCREGRKVTALIQVAKELGDEKTKSRELKALFKAMDETGLKNGTIVTYEDEEEIKENSKTITIIPAYKFFIPSCFQK
jgi:predicted AAA+ superfamily ATPase